MDADQTNHSPAILGRGVVTSRAPGRFPIIKPAPRFEPLVDGERRSVRYLRLSVTDRCNFRCVYCMPEDGLPFAPRADVLTFEEIERLTRVFVDLGVTRVRLTGGEPLLRSGLPTLVGKLEAIPGLSEIALSTNGFLLAPMARDLAAAGVDRVNISLDTLQAARFHTLARIDGLDRVIAGIDAALEVGMTPVKLNTVVIGGVNDDELPALVRFAATRGALIRFIEHMPIGVDGFWSDASFVPVNAMRERLAAEYAFAARADIPFDPNAGPARYTTLTPHDGSHPPVEVGFITAVSDHFCNTCNRVRVTATGTLQECLAFPGHISLRDAVRNDAFDDSALAALVGDALSLKGPGHRFGDGQYTLQSMSITGG
jgi:cyclic pyranopterin phosphate synthase